ncbi:MAG: ChbG/HpnK family deacetylase [Deltaproteobacteria bacterium]|nr:ChbG/HpnK family deacetylase [Deltaproteobacteria bacterium]
MRNSRKGPFFVMQVIVSADDLGLTRGITDGILAARDHGCLSGTSVIAGGDAFDYAIEQWRRRPGWLLTAHLNLMEGRPVAPPGEVAMLLDGNGEMALSFVALLRLSLRLRGAQREHLRTQIRTELDAQLRRVADAAGPGWRPRVDGHQHYHMIPIVLEALLELHERWDFSYVRALEEPLFMVPTLRRALPNYLGPNLAKHAILRPLARRARRELARRAIPHCRWFVGLLFSGNMTIEPVRAALAHLARRDGGAARSGDLVEFLLHPGRAADHEAARWGERAELREYYLSPWRDTERATLCSAEMRAALAPHLVAEETGAR